VTILRQPAIRYDACPEICARLDHPGLATDISRWINHVGLDTTVDQASIEDALAALGLGGEQQILHVGVGNSQFAQRFAPMVARIDGITVWEPERTLAAVLGIANYTVHFLSKYSREFLLTIDGTYDYIIDNNLASFACCKYHFHRMFDNYLWCLRPGGRILTDQRGMDWTVEDDPRWQLTYDDLVAVGQRFALRAARLTETVYELRREASA
jgi:hypothetical protein